MESKLKHRLSNELLEGVLGVNPDDYNKILNTPDSEVSKKTVKMLGKRYSVEQAQEIILRHFEHAESLIEKCENIFNSELELALGTELKQPEPVEHSVAHRMAHYAGLEFDTHNPN